MVNIQIRDKTQSKEREAAPLLAPEKPVGLSGLYIEVPPGLLFAFSTVEPDPPPTAGPVPVVGPVL
jgi:hypothetical protein